MIFNSDELEALESGVTQMGAFVRIQTTLGFVRLWGGFGTIASAAVDEGSETYTGIGTIINLPVFQQVINGAADRYNYTLSGINSEIAAFAANKSAEIKQKPCDLGIGIFGQDWQLLGPIHWIRRGYASMLKLSTIGAKTVQDITTRTASLSVGSLMTGRLRPEIEYWTDQDQRQISSDDSFCERTVAYVEGVNKRWPS